MRDGEKGARSQHPSLEEEMAVPRPRLFAPFPALPAQPPRGPVTAFTPRCRGGGQEGKQSKEQKQS